MTATPRALPTALIVGRGLPELGGIPAFLETLVTALAHSGRYEPRFVNLADESARHSAGRLRAGNVTRTLRDASAVWFGLRGVAVMHYSCATTPLAVLRGAVFCLLARMRSVPAIMHFHSSEICGWVPRWWGRPLLRAAAWPCARIVTVSKPIRDAAAEVLGDSVDLVVNAVDVDGFADARRVAQMKRDDDRCRFVYVGVLAERKGLGVLLDAILAMRERDEFSVVIAGGAPAEGPEEAARIEAAYAAAGLEQVGFAGRLDGTGVRDLLAESDVLVLASFAEGLPIVVIEAMAAGLAVVATPVGDIPSVIADGTTGLLVEPGNAQQLSDAMLRLADDRSLCERIGNAAAEVAEERFDARRLAAQIADIFDAARQDPSKA